MVRCACDALIAGLDSPSLRILAGLTRTEADYHMLGILPAALAELGLDFYPRGSCSGQEGAACALAAQAVSGSLTPRKLAAAIRRHFGHGMPLTERLAALDDEYDPRRIRHHDARANRPGSHRRSPPAHTRPT